MSSYRIFYNFIHSAVAKNPIPRNNDCFSTQARRVFRGTIHVSKAVERKKKIGFAFPVSVYLSPFSVSRATFDRELIFLMDSLSADAPAAASRAVASRAAVVEGWKFNFLKHALLTVYCIITLWTHRYI